MGWLTERSRVDPVTGCWLWTRTKTRGYGWAKRKGKAQGAHRHAWEIAHGPIPEGMTVHHTCFTPPCVNPDHLVLLSQSRNASIRDPGSTVRRIKGTCKRDHPMSGDNLYIKPSGKRVCRICHALRERERHRRKKENE